MSRFVFVVLFSGLFNVPIVPAQEPPKAADRTASAAAWPPEHLRNLPADYLQRIHASLEAGTARLAKLNNRTATGTDSIGWVRYGMPALILGKRKEDINAFFESDKFVVSANPKFGFSLFGTSYMRMYGLMNHRTGSMKGYLSTKAVENFEKGFWTVAK